MSYSFVMTDNGPVEIRDLIPGMKVKCQDGWNELKDYPKQIKCIRMKFHGLPTTYFPSYMTKGNGVKLGDFVPSEGEELPGNRMISVFDNTCFLNIGKNYDKGCSMTYKNVKKFNSFAKNLILYAEEVPEIRYGNGNVWLHFSNKVKSRELTTKDFTIRNMEHYLSGMLDRRFSVANVHKMFISHELSESDKLILSFLKLLVTPHVNNGNRVINEKEMVAHLIYKEDKSKVPLENIPYYLKSSPNYEDEEIVALETEECMELYPDGLYADVNGLRPIYSKETKYLRWI